MSHSRIVHVALAKLIMGKSNGSAIGTLVERSTRFTVLLHLPNGRTAERVRDALLDAVAVLPAHLRRSLTWDQGVEMGRHAEFAAASGMAVFFCDPASPWQRGSNENTVSLGDGSTGLLSQAGAGSSR